MSSLPPPPVAGLGGSSASGFGGPSAGFGDPTAVMGRRIAAYVIDVLICWAVFVVAFVAVGDSVASGVDLCGFEGSPDLCIHTGDSIYFAEGGDAGVVTLSGIGAWFLFGIVVQGLTGGTPGKLLLGLRVVVRDTGARAGIGRNAARTVMWVVDAFPYFVPLVGLVVGAASPGHRRVGDMVAGTVVVAKDRVGEPAVTTLAGSVPLGGWAPPAGAGTPSAPASWAPPVDPHPPASWAPPVDPHPPASWAPPTGAPVPAPGAWDTPARPPGAAPFPEDPAVFERPRPEPVAPIDAVPATAPTPQWDAARNAWILWDPAQNRWLAHDTASDQWRPI